MSLKNSESVIGFEVRDLFEKFRIRSWDFVQKIWVEFGKWVSFGNRDSGLKSQNSGIGIGIWFRDPDWWPLATGSHDCDVEAECTNVSGSFECKCLTGFEGDGRNCLDVDECQTGDIECPPYSRCRNFYGTFDCHCTNGYVKEEGLCVLENYLRKI